MYHISDASDSTTSRILKIDEIKLNAVLDKLPPESFEKHIRKRLPDPSKKRSVLNAPVIPKNLKSAIYTLRLLDEESFSRRVELFIGYCLYKSYSYNTVIKYFSILKRNNVFGNDNSSEDLRPCKLAFIDSGRPHVRIVSMDNFLKFVHYLNNNLSKYTAPVLTAAHTSLRTNEILQFTTNTLFELDRRMQPVSIRLKKTIVNPEKNEPLQWHPVYNSYLNLFVKNLITLYSDEYEAFEKHGINIKLFDIDPKTMSNRTKTLYYNAVGCLAPNGFGIHSFRNMVAMLMARNTDNIVGIQRLLNHRSIKTTRRYIKADYQETAAEMNRLTKFEFATIRKNLKNPNEE